MFSYEKIPELIGSTSRFVAQCSEDIDELQRSYAELRLEVESSVEDSRRGIQEELTNKRSRRDGGLNQCLEKCREYVRYIQELNDDARSKSKSYQKTCAENERNGFQQPQHYLETLEQCQEKLQRLSDQAKVAHEGILSTGGIGGLIGSISGESKKHHMSLIDATKVSRDTISRAEAIASGIGRLEGESDEAVANRRIEEAEAEGTALLQQIAEKEYSDIEESLAWLRLRLNELFSAGTIAALSELSDLVEPVEGSAPEGFCQQLKLGTYSYQIQGWPFSDSRSGIESVLKEHFGAWYNLGRIEAPAIIDRAESSSVVLCGNAKVTSPALNWLAVSELETNQAPWQNYIFINPSGDRRVFEPFLAAVKECPEVFGERIITDSRAMSEALERAVSLIDDRNQQFLIGYRDVFEFNDSTETTELPLVTICMSASLEELDKRDVENVRKIVRNGSFCGVNLLLAIDVDQSDVDEASEFLASCGKALIGWPSENNPLIDVGQGVGIVYEPVSWRRVESDLLRVQSQVENQLSQSVSLESVFPSGTWHEGSTLEGLSIPMGKSSDGKQISLEFGPKVSNGISHFGLMTGATGSGKSSLLHSIIVSSLLKYGPDELQLYLLDFKSGVEFEIYSKFNIPQLRLLALDAMQAFGLSILRELMSQMDERNRLFKYEGVENIEEYRRATGNAMPRILVLMDEFQTLFNEDHDRRAARDSAVLLADFISLARNCGIHFLLSTQTLKRLSTGNFSVSQSTLDEMHVRIGLQCSQNEAEKLFGDIFGKRAFELMGAQKGSGVLTENDLKLPPVAFRSVYCSKEERITFLEEIERRYSAINVSKSTQVFRSDSVPEIRAGINQFRSLGNESQGNTPIFLGEPIRIGDPVVVNVSRRMRSTTLFAGGEYRMLEMLVANYLFSAFLANERTKEQGGDPLQLRPAVYLCDGRTLIGEAGGGDITRVCSGRYEDVKIARSNTDVLKYVDELYDIMSERQKVGGSSYQNVHFVVNEFQWIDSFLAIFERRDGQYDSEEFGESQSSYDPDAILDEIISGISRPTGNENLSRLEKLDRLVRRGYAYGINIVLGTSDFPSLRERLYDLVPNMQNRILFALSGEDAERLVHGAFGQMETLRSNMALISDGRGDPEIFKPYRISEI